MEIFISVCTDRVNLLNLKEKFREATNHCKQVLETAAKLEYANITKEYITSQKLLANSQTLRTFGKMLIVFSTKVNLLYLLYSMA